MDASQPLHLRLRLTCQPSSLYKREHGHILSRKFPHRKLSFTQNRHTVYNEDMSVVFISLMCCAHSTNYSKVLKTSADSPLDPSERKKFDIFHIQNVCINCCNIWINKIHQLIYFACLKIWEWHMFKNALFMIIKNFNHSSAESGNWSCHGVWDTDTLRALE